MLVTVLIPYVRKIYVYCRDNDLCLDLLQAVAFSYWAHALGMEGDFKVQPEALKALGVAVLIGVSYLIQAYYQDILVSRAFLLLHGRLVNKSK